jgi:hypothetical protein
MSYHKNIARVTEYAPHSTDEEFEYEPFELGKLFPVDPYMGFSQSLIILLGRVSDLLVINTRDGPKELRREIETMYVKNQRLALFSSTSLNFPIDRSC